VDYFTSLADWTPPGMTRPVLESLCTGDIQVVCVGDGFHSERRAIHRWKDALQEFTGQFKKHKAMDEEMNESLSVMQIVMEWKTAFPDSFHFLKGNHENVANENSEDNRAFRKFAFEGDMVALWFRKFLGDEIFKSYYTFEKHLPIFAVGNGFCVTHAEPQTHYTREQIIGCYSNRTIIFDFTWTDDDAAEDDSVAAYLSDYFPDIPEARMFGGHRPVRDLYNPRAGGLYIQIHNPAKKIAAFVRDIQTFNPDTDITELE
jgi:hypothetical protein